MAGQDTNDFLAAFGIGAVLGVGAALLLRPERPDPRRRLLKKAKRHGRGARGNAARVRRMAKAGAGEGVGMTHEAIDAGRELLAEFRGEVAHILDEARRELRELRGAHHPPEPGAGDGA